VSTATFELEHLAPSAYGRLVALEVNEDGTATLYERPPAGAVTPRTVPFQPWLLVAGDKLAAQVPGTAAVQPLEGDARFKHRLHFPTSKALDAAVRFLKSQTKRNPTDADAPYRLFTDPQQQALSLLPARLFRGIGFADIVRLQLDIETYTTPGFEFPNSERPEDRILMVSLRDSTGWEHCLSSPELNEAEILAAMVAAIRERDPDVIEGHNLFTFDLPYIETRCRLHKVPLALGRDGSRLASRPSRFTAGEHTSAYNRYTAYGRHIVDTYHLVQLYDVQHRDLESYSLKAVARHFGVAAAGRTYIEGEAISRQFEADAARVRAYAMDDVRETAAIAAILAPSYFYQTQLVPFSYQNCVTRGTAARIDALLVADYLVHNRAIPAPAPARPFRGALTESQEQGVFANVWHVDVRSLYPSILISRAAAPAQDRAGVFLTALADLRRFRLAAKDAARAAHARAERDHFDALQGSFKILINSFYGYLGFAQATFNDFTLAETVTATGREILSGMTASLEGNGCRVIEMDTDGIYFLPAPGMTDTADLVARIQATLPPGIEVDLDATYAAMFGYKSKNYALLGHDGQVSITGAALKSRGLEPFQRKYITELVTLLLKGKPEDVAALYRRYRTAIETHALPFADLAKREVLSTSPAAYRDQLDRGETRRSAAYDLVLASGREYRQGDQVAFYVTGTRKNVVVADSAKLLGDADPAARDENVAYYLDKLDKLHEKFAAFVPAPPSTDRLPGM